MLDPAHASAIVPGGNGVFRATVVRAGRVVGTWTRTLGPDRVTVNVQPVVELDGRQRTRVEHALGGYARFLDRTLRSTGV